MQGYVYGPSDYIRVFRERWRTIALVTLVTILGSLAYTASQDATQAVAPSSVVEATPSIEIPAGLSYVLLEGDPLTETDPAAEALRFSVGEVLDVTADRTGISVSELATAVRVQAVGQGQAFAISATNVGATSGDEIAHEVGLAYLEIKKAETLDRYRAGVEALEAQIEALDTPNGDSTVQLVRAMKIASLTTELAELKSQMATVRGGTLLEGPGEADVPEDTKINVSPPYKRNGVAGLVLGLILGAGIALFQDFLNPRFRTAEEMQEVLRLPVLAHFPDADGQRKDAAAAVWEQIAARGLGSVAVISFSDRGTDQELASHLSAATGEPATHKSFVPASSSTDPGSYLSTARSSDGAIVVIDKQDVPREQAVNEVDKIRRTGTDVLGLIVS